MTVESTISMCSNCTTVKTKHNADNNGTGGLGTPWLGVLYVVPVVFTILILYFLLRRYYKRLRRAWGQHACGGANKESVELAKIITGVGNYEATSRGDQNVLKKIQQQGVQVILPVAEQDRRFLDIGSSFDKNGEPLSSTKETAHPNKLSVTVGTQGKTVQVGCYTLRFPPKCLKTDTLIVLTVLPPDNEAEEGFFRLAPVLRCEPSGVQFIKPFQVTVKSSFFAWKPRKIVTVKVGVRENDSAPWEDESTTLLGHDGKAVFSASHFSERAVDCSLDQRARVGREMCTFGFQKFLDRAARDITWYVMERKNEVDFARVRGWHTNDEASISYQTIRVRLSCRLQLALSSNRDVNLDPNEEFVESWDLESNNTRAKTFLAELAENIQPKRSTIKFAIEEQPITLIPGQGANRKVTNGRFYIQWQQQLPKSESTTNINICDSQHINIGNQGDISYNSSSSSIQNLGIETDMSPRIHGRPASRIQLPSTPNDSRDSTLARSTPHSDSVFWA